MGKRKETLTNEKLVADRFDSLFDLVNHAIGVAKDKIKSGRDTHIKTDIRNTAYQILREIEEGKDLLEVEEEEVGDEFEAAASEDGEATEVETVDAETAEAAV